MRQIYETLYELIELGAGMVSAINAKQMNKENKILYYLLKVTLLGILSLSQTANAETLDLYSAKFKQPSAQTNDPKLIMRSWVGRSLVMATEAMEQARYRVKDYKTSEKFGKILDQMNRVKLTWPDFDENDINCVKNYPAMAYVNTSRKDVINICHAGMYEYSRNHKVELMAQSLIHEAAHTVGIMDECEATYLEITAAQNSFLERPFKNGYWSTCNFDVPARN